jgi:hypothetical protein
VFPDLFDIREAFTVLSSSRSAGFGVGCIPLTEIESYIRLYEAEDIDRFIQLIRAMDGAFVQKVNQRNERKLKT